MTRFERRQVLSAAGASVGAGGLTGSALASDTSSDQAEPEQQAEITNIMTARGTGGGLLAVSESSVTDAYNNGIELPGSETEPTFELTANVYSDGTWESTNVNFADVPIEELIGEDQLDQYSSLLGKDLSQIPVEIRVPNGLTGNIQYGDQTHLLELDGTVELYVGFSEVLTNEPDLTHQINLTGTTTEQSGVLIGEADFSTEPGTARIVNNVFEIPATNRSLFDGLVNVDDELGLPSESGESWLEMSAIEVAFEDYISQPPAIVGDTPPQRSGIDNRWDIVTGDAGSENCVSILDVQALFSNLDSPDVQNNVDAFGFSNSGRDKVTIFDVQALYSRIGESC